MLKNELIISGLQYNIAWENAEENIRFIERSIKALEIKPDLIVLPETFTTGFTKNTSAVAESMDDYSINALKKIAKETQIAICGSLIISYHHKLYNRFVFVHPGGQVEFYDKRHLFSMGGEKNAVSSGDSRVIIKYKGWRIKPQICYDLRFPVWSRNENNYDLLINCSNWPKARNSVWNILLKARAIENQCYVFGVNRIGTDNNGIDHIGQTQCVDANGELLVKADSGSGFITTTLNLEELHKFRKEFPVLDDRDAFSIAE